LVAVRKQVLVAVRKQVWVAGHKKVLVAVRKQVLVAVRKQVWVAVRKQVWVAVRRQVLAVDRIRVWAAHISVSDFSMNRQDATGTYLVVHKLAWVVSEVHMNWTEEDHTMASVPHTKVWVVSNFLRHWEVHMMTMGFRWKVWKTRTILEEVVEDPVEVKHGSLQCGLYLRHHQ
jgi:hypothetical protein